MERGENHVSARERPARRPLLARRKLLFAAVTVVVFYGVLEGLARLAATLLIEDALETSTLRSIWAEQGWAVDPVLGWTMIKSDAHMRGGTMSVTNSHGFRSPEFSVAKAPDAIRVLAVGDSTVMGFGVEQDEVFTHRLQQELGSLFDRPVEVVNAGVPGYSSEQVRLYLETRGMALDPDVVIFQASFNDRRAVAPGGEPDSREHFESISRRLAIFELLNYSAVAQLLRRAVSDADLTLLRSGDYDFTEIAVDSPPRVLVDRFEQNVREIVRLARRGGAEVVLVALPDNPVLVGRIVRARDLLEAGKLWEAERELLGPFQPMQRLLAQKTLNQVLERGNRSVEIRTTVPAQIPSKSTGGYTPVSLAHPYIAALKRIGTELEVPVIVAGRPESGEPGESYIDQSHLSALGHKILASDLARALTTLAALSQ